MKQTIITLLLACIACISLQAEERKITLHEKAHNSDLRSLPHRPAVVQDGNLLRVYSEITIEIQITITDLSANTIIELNNITVQCNQPYTLFLDNVESGNYIIELHNERISYYGTFDL
ncbi:DUF3244 domain-containing protein [Bacteroides fluxus]|jgi:hypothetical protein